MSGSSEGVRMIPSVMNSVTWAPGPGQRPVDRGDPEHGEERRGEEQCKDDHRDQAANDRMEVLDTVFDACRSRLFKVGVGSEVGIERTDTASEFHRCHSLRRIRQSNCEINQD